ncbi:MAG TPA: hypothetical protein VLD37_07710 [Candidatus Bilamarchaeum sp.]|nr:hypothetical protein [Candidatus Bilamarchaeum sp.]
MKFKSRFVQYPRPVTFLILAFDLIMAAILTYLGVLLLFIIPYALPLSLAAIVPLFFTFVLASNFLIDISSLKQKSIEADSKGVKILSFGTALEVPLDKVNAITLIRLRIPVATYYARLSLPSGSRTVELSEADYTAFAAFLRQSGFTRSAVLKIPFYSADLHKIPST